MNLAVDIGNSSAKIAVFNDLGEPIEQQCTTHQQIGLLHHTVKRHPGIRRGIVSSVIELPRDTAELLASLPIELLMLDSDTPLPIKNGYRTPRTLGCDRLAAMVGAYTQKPGHPILCIDAGTAITYDFMDGEGCYRGGNIAPGVRMRLQALHRFTSRLPLVEAAGEVPPLGYDTETAIRSGVITGIANEMNGYIESLKEKNPSLLVFLTGGDEFSFDSKIKSSIFADKNLVLKGLNAILNYNET